VTLRSGAEQQGGREADGEGVQALEAHGKQGPLKGVRVVELAGIGPGPFCAMLLADMGAEIIRIDRAGAVRGFDPATPSSDLLNRGRRSVGVDLKHPDGVATVLDLVEQVLDDPFPTPAVGFEHGEVRLGRAPVELGLDQRVEGARVERRRAGGVYRQESIDNLLLRFFGGRRSPPVLRPNLAACWFGGLPPPAPGRWNPRPRG